MVFFAYIPQGSRYLDSVVTDASRGNEVDNQNEIFKNNVRLSAKIVGTFSVDDSNLESS